MVKGVIARGTVALGVLWAEGGPSETLGAEAGAVLFVG